MTAKDLPANSHAPPAQEYRAGSVTIVGRPNVGKSTLLNALMEMRLAIVTPRPQTTRNRIAGIRTETNAQFVFVDTPGIHDPRSGLLSRRLVDVARRALAETDVALLVIDSHAGIRQGDRDIAETIQRAGTPVVVALNKMDQIARPALLPLMQIMGSLLPDADVVPVSAERSQNLSPLMEAVHQRLPHGPALYPSDELTDQSERFIAQELVREQVFHHTRNEIPYACAVVTEVFREQQGKPGTADVLHVHATVLVGRPSHKPIVIGKGGLRLREIGRQARLRLEEFFAKRVYLELFVKVEPDWERNPTVLQDVGL